MSKELELIANLSKGNIGAVRVLADIMQDKNAKDYFSAMEDMNLYGPDIFVGYRAICNEALAQFKSKILERDPDFVKAINESSLGSGREVVIRGAIAKAASGKSQSL